MKSRAIPEICLDQNNGVSNTGLDGTWLPIQHRGVASGNKLSHLLRSLALHLQNTTSKADPTTTAPTCCAFNRTILRLNEPALKAEATIVNYIV